MLYNWVMERSPGVWPLVPMRGHVAAISSKRSKARAELKIEPVAKASCEPPRFIREFRTDAEDAACEVGQKLTLELFAEVARVDVIGMIKGFVVRLAS